MVIYYYNNEHCVHSFIPHSLIVIINFILLSMYAKYSLQTISSLDARTTHKDKCYSSMDMKIPFVIEFEHILHSRQARHVLREGPVQGFQYSSDKYIIHFEHDFISVYHNYIKSMTYSLSNAYSINYQFFRLTTLNTLNRYNSKGTSAILIQVITSGTLLCDYLSVVGFGEQYTC